MGRFGYVFESGAFKWAGLDLDVFESGAFKWAGLDMCLRVVHLNGQVWICV